MEFSLPWYVIATFWLLVGALIFSSKARWLLMDLLRLAGNKRSHPYRPSTFMGKDKETDDDSTVIVSGLRGLGYSRAEAEEASAYVDKHYPKEPMKDKMVQAIRYFDK